MTDRVDPAVDPPQSTRFAGAVDVTVG